MRKATAHSEEPELFPHAARECAFCSIASHVEAAAIVYEDPEVIIILDRRPLFPGHCLLIPIQHIEVLADLPPELVPSVFEKTRLLSIAVERAMRAEGTFVAINNRVSQSVAHLHIHVVPRSRKDGLKGFFWPRQKYSDEKSMSETQQAISSALRGLMQAH